LFYGSPDETNGSVWSFNLERSVFRQAGNQFHRHQIEQGLGDTMIKTSTLSMAVFALLVNSTVLLSLSM
jgi:hypothetical protein